MDIWRKIKNNAEKEKRPILLLAPMADVTDAAFRKIIAKYGKPDAMWTEFVSVNSPSKISVPILMTSAFTFCAIVTKHPTSQRPLETINNS